MNKERLFLAVALGREQRAGIERSKEALQAKLSFQKWVHPDDLHITLKFLGDTDSETAARVKTAMKELASNPDLTSFSLSLKELGVFGKPAAPSVLWIGLSGDLPALGALQASVEQAVQPLGFVPEDRPYSPHITLARRYNGGEAFSKSALGEAREAMDPFEKQWGIDKFVLFRSHLNRRPMYEVLSEFELRRK